MSDEEDIEALIAGSSLGSPGARSLRARTSPELREYALLRAAEVTGTLTLAQRQDMVRDAIILERALRVLYRRYRASIMTSPHGNAAKVYLRLAAAELRRKGERGSGSEAEGTARPDSGADAEEGRC